jgi:hypothetical protein
MNDGFFKPEPSVHLFVPPNHAKDPNAPCLFTRGYWQRRSKEIFACPCEGPLPRGSSAALCGFTLAPEAHLEAD